MSSQPPIVSGFAFDPAPVERGIQTLISLLDRLEQSASRAIGVVQGSGASVGGSAQEVNQFNTAISSLDTNVGRIATTLQGFETRIEGIVNRLLAVPGAVSQAGNALNNLPSGAAAGGAGTAAGGAGTAGGGAGTAAQEQLLRLQESQERFAAVVERARRANQVATEESTAGDKRRVASLLQVEDGVSRIEQIEQKRLRAEGLFNRAPEGSRQQIRAAELLTRFTDQQSAAQESASQKTIAAARTQQTLGDAAVTAGTRFEGATNREINAVERLALAEDRQAATQQTVAQVATQAQETQAAAVQQLTNVQEQAAQAQQQFAATGANATQQQINASQRLQASLQQAATVQANAANQQQQSAQTVTAAQNQLAQAQQNVARAQVAADTAQGGPQAQQQAATGQLVTAINQLIAAYARLNAAQTQAANVQNRGAQQTQVAAGRVQQAVNAQNAALNATGPAAQTAGQGMGRMHDSLLGVLAVSRLLPSPIAEVTSSIGLFIGAARSGAGITAALVAGFVGAVASAVQFGLSLNKTNAELRATAEGIGLTFSEVKALKAVAESTGQSIENFTIGLRNISQAITNRGPNAARTRTAIEQILGPDFELKGKRAIDVLKALFIALENPSLQRSGVALAAFSDIAGRSYDEQAAAARGLTKDLDLVEAAYKRQGLTSEEVTALAERQRESMLKLTIAWDLFLQKSGATNKAADFLDSLSALLSNPAESILAQIKDFLASPLSLSLGENERKLVDRIVEEQKAAGDKLKKEKEATASTAVAEDPFVKQAREIGLELIAIEKDFGTVSGQERVAAERLANAEVLKARRDLIEKEQTASKESLIAAVQNIRTLEGQLVALQQGQNLGEGVTPEATQAFIDQAKRSLAKATEALKLRGVLLAKFDEEIRRLQQKGRSPEEDEIARQFQEDLEAQKVSVREGLANLQEKQRERVAQLQADVKTGKAPFTAALVADIENAKAFLEQSSGELDILVQLITERIAKLKKDLEGPVTREFEKQTNADIKRLQHELDQFTVERGKNDRKKNLDIAKAERDLDEQIGDVDRNRLTLANALLTAAESRLKLLQEENLIFGPDAKERQFQLDKRRIDLIQQEIVLARQRLAIQLEGARAEAIRQQDKTVVERIAAGETPTAAATAGAAVGQTELARQLSAKPIVDLRNEIVGLSESASEAALKLQRATSVLGRIRTGLDGVIDALDRAPDSFDEFSTAIVQRPLKGLATALRGAQALIDAIQQKQTPKTLPEAVIDAGGKFEGHVKTSGELFSDAVAAASRRFAEALQGFPKSQISQSSEATSAATEVARDAQEISRSGSVIVRAIAAITGAVGDQQKALEKLLATAPVPFSENLARGTQTGGGSKIAELAAGKSLGGVPLDLLLSTIAKIESNFRPGIVGIEGPTLPSGRRNPGAGQKRFGEFQFAKGTVDPVLDKLGVSFKEFLEDEAVQIAAVTDFLTERFEFFKQKGNSDIQALKLAVGAGGVRGARGAAGAGGFGPATLDAVKALIESLRKAGKLVSEIVLDDALQLEGLLAANIGTDPTIQEAALGAGKEIAEATVSGIGIAAKKASASIKAGAAIPIPTSSSADTSDSQRELERNLGRINPPPPPSGKFGELTGKIISKAATVASGVIQGLSAETIGGKIAGFSSAAAIIPVVGPIIAAAGQIIGGIADFVASAYKKRAEKVAADFDENFKRINDALRDGSVTLGEGISQIQKQLESARAQLGSGKINKKGGAAILKQIETQAGDALKQLREQAKKIQEDFAKSLDTLRLAPELRSIASAVDDAGKKLKEFLGSFETGAEALKHFGEAEEFLALTMKDLKATATDQLTSVIKREQEAELAFQQSREQLINQGRVTSPFDAAQDRLQQLFELERRRAEERASAESEEAKLQKQISFIDASFQKASDVIDKMRSSFDSLVAGLGQIFGGGGGGIGSGIGRGEDLVSLLRASPSALSSPVLSGTLNIGLNVTGLPAGAQVQVRETNFASNQERLGLVSRVSIGQARPLV